LEFGYKQWFLPELARIRVVHWRLLGFLPVLTLAALIYHYLWPNKPAKDQTGRSLILHNILTITGAIAVLLCLGTACYLSYLGNTTGRRKLVENYYVCHEQWSDLIDFARKVPTENYPIELCWDVNFALYMTGRLGDEMFMFPQQGKVLRDDLDSPFKSPVNDYKLVQVYLSMGRANDAEVVAQESITRFKQNPRAMGSLARIYLVKNNAPAARRYLNTLSYDLILGAWARDLLAQLDRDSTLAGNADIQRLRRQALPRYDMFPGQSDAEMSVSFDNLERAGGLLGGLLEKCPTNQIAFEYEMAQLMLSNDLTGLRKLAPQIKNMTGPAYVTPDGRRRTPVYFQEALAISCDKAGPLKIEGFEIESNTLRRMAEFKTIMSMYPDRQKALSAVAWKFRNTYFYYNCSGPGGIR
jgi:hypothetical protein